MASPQKPLLSDSSSYLEAFEHYQECSSGYQQMQDFMDNLMSDILTRSLKGKSHLDVIGVGNGSGEVDLKLFSALHVKYPQMTVDNEVVEPNVQQLRDYRDLVSRTPGLDYIKFTWNNMTAEEFEEHWKGREVTKKVDLIHMLQVLYYVKDLEDSIGFYQSLLNKNGKLLITLLSGDSGSVQLRETYKNQLCNGDMNVSSHDIKKILDSKGLSYQTHDLPAQIDVTECFTEGDEKGELLLDFITHVRHFSKSASPELKAGVMEFLRRPDYSEESDGKVIFKLKYELIVVDQLG